MTPKRKRHLFNGIGLLFSVIFLYLCFHSLNRQDLKTIFLIPQPSYFIVIIFLNFVIMGIRTTIWKLLLNPLGSLPFWKLFDVSHIGFMANQLLPLKAGEFFRASFISKKFKLPYTQVLTTVALERYFAGSSLIFLFLLVAGTVKIPFWLKSGAYIMATILLAVQIALIIIWKRPPKLEKWNQRHPIIYRVFEFLFHVGEGSQQLKSWKSLIVLNLLAILNWLAQLAMLKLIEMAFQIHLGILPSLFVVIAINLAVALPSAPGNLGTFEFAAVLSYSVLGIDKAVALGIGLYFHFLQSIPVTLVGLFYYFRWGIRLKDMEEAVDSKSDSLSLAR